MARASRTGPSMQPALLAQLEARHGANPLEVRRGANQPGVRRGANQPGARCGANHREVPYGVNELELRLRESESGPEVQS